MCAWSWNVEYLRVLSLIPSWREPWWGFSLLKKVILSDYYCPTIHKDVYDLLKGCDMCQRRGEISRKIKFPKNLILEVRLFDIWASMLWEFVRSYDQNYIRGAVDYVSIWVKLVTLANNDGRSVARFSKKNIFSRFGTLEMIISDEGIFLP